MLESTSSAVRRCAGLATRTHGLRRATAIAAVAAIGLSACADMTDTQRRRQRALASAVRSAP